MYIPIPWDLDIFVVSGAGSSQYNGTYYYNGNLVDNRHVYEHESNSSYTIEYDLTDYWCIMDSGTPQYCTWCDNYLLTTCPKGFNYVINGISPFPRFEELKTTIYQKCEQPCM
jgi:hypothetical protein